MAMLDVLGSRAKLPVLERWLASEQGSTAALQLRAVLYLEMAWRVASTGRAETSQASQVRPWLEQSDRDLAHATELDPADPSTYALRITVAMLLTRGHETALGYLHSARQLCRGHVEAHERMLQYLCKKWGGCNENMFELARLARAGATAGSPLHCLIATAHIERWLDERDRDLDASAAYFRRSDVMDELRAAYESAFADNRRMIPLLDARPLNRLAFCFACGGALTAAREIFARIGEHFTQNPWCYGGDPELGFLRARAQAGLV